MNLYHRPRAATPLGRWSLKRWRRSPLGRRLLQTEEQLLRQVLPDLFGRTCLQIGNWGQPERMLGAASGFAVRGAIGTLPMDGVGGVASLEQLPLLDKSVDALLLPHVHEFCRDPRPVLREASRVLSDRGTLLVLGFNPWSLWGLRRLPGLRYRLFPGGARFYSAGRLCDWLELLGFEIGRVRRYPVGPSLLAAGDDEGLQRLLGGYLILARKRVRPVNLVGRVQRANIRSLVGGLALPEARLGGNRRAGTGETPGQ